MATNNVNVQQALGALGRPASDKVTGAKGIVTSVAFDLYGCVSAWLTPKAITDGKPGDGMWYDLKRLVVSKQAPVLETPTFDSIPGPERKSAPISGPR